MVVGDPPPTVLADKQIAGGEGAATQFLLTQYQGRVAVKQHALVITGDAGRVWVRQDRDPARYDRLPVGQYRPSRVKAGNGRAARPQRVHGGDVARSKGAVEFEVGGEHGVVVGHVDPRPGISQSYVGRSSPASRFAWRGFERELCHRRADDRRARLPAPIAPAPDTLPSTPQACISTSAAR